MKCIAARFSEMGTTAGTHRMVTVWLVFGCCRGLKSGRLPRYVRLSLYSSSLKPSYSLCFSARDEKTASQLVLEIPTSKQTFFIGLRPSHLHNMFYFIQKIFPKILLLALLMTVRMVAELFTYIMEPRTVCARNQRRRLRPGK